MKIEKSFKIALFCYFLFILLIFFGVSKKAMFFVPQGKSKIETLDSNSLDNIFTKLNERNYSINVEKIEVNNYNFGNDNPFQENYAISE